MKYSEFPYRRITVESQGGLMDAWLEKFENAESVEVQIGVLTEVDAAKREYESYKAIATVNFNRNVKDEAANAERDYYDAVDPDIREVYNRFDVAVTKSPFRAELAQKLGATFFNKIEMELKTFDPQIKDMLREETELQNEYTKLIASARIDFDGDIYNLTGLVPLHLSEDRDVRKRSHAARYEWYERHASLLDELYDKLVKLRHRMAQTLGFKNFVELAYLRRGRSDYGPGEVAKFRKQIVDHVVPIVTRLKEQKKAILGLDHIYVYDAISFKEGDPRPKGTPDRLVDQARRMYHELSPETGEFFDMMVSEELMDLVNRDGKMEGGFCLAFPHYERPYIFSNFNGTYYDVTVLTHEAGHAFQYYSSRKQPLMAYECASTEAAEIPSMSMELLTWKWMDLFFEEDADKFRYKHMTVGLSLLPYTACGDDFQHWVFENPEATPANRREKWSELESVYMPDRDYGDLESLNTGGIWPESINMLSWLNVGGIPSK